jgi:purine-cytosine permease-like protein
VPPASASVTASIVVTALVLAVWMIVGIREYRRTGRATWLWLGVLMAVSLAVAALRVVG